MIPSQKLGNETPNSDTAEASVSQMVSRRTAARTPRGTATTSARRSAPPVSWSVGPRRSRIRLRTGSPVLKERPRSPRDGGQHPAPVLGRERPIQAEPLAHLGGDLLRELAADQHRLRSARRQAHQREENDGDADKHQPSESEPLRDVAPETSIHLTRWQPRAGGSRGWSARQRG